MPLYRNNGASMPQAAQSAMSSATSAMAHQQKTETRTTTQKTNFWDDLYKGSRAVGAMAGAANHLVEATTSAVNLYDEFQIKGAYDDIAKAFQEGGYDAIQNNPNMQNYHHSQAFGRFVKDRANTEKGFMEMMQNADALADRQYLQWRQQALATREAYKSGDMNKYAAAMQELVASSPMPYRLEADGNGNFIELFRSDKEGGWTATGSIITPEQANEQMEAMLKGEQMVLRGADMKTMPANRVFNQAANRFRYSTMMGNAENRLDPKKQVPLYDRNGNVAGIGVIQNPIDDYSAGPKLFVYGSKDGRNLGVFDGYEGVMKAGLSPFMRRAAKGGGSHGVGNGKGAGGAPASGFAVKDSSLFTKFATITDPTTGEKFIDHSLAALLENVQRTTGKTGNAVIAAFEENTRRAMAQGMSQEQAQKAVMSAMAQRINASAQQNTNQPQQKAQGHAANAGGAVKPDNPAVARVQKAAVGRGASSKKEERDPNSVAGAQQGALDFFNWFKEQPRGASNNFGEEYE